MKKLKYTDAALVMMEEAYAPNEDIYIGTTDEIRRVYNSIYRAYMKGVDLKIYILHISARRTVQESTIFRHKNLHMEYSSIMMKTK